jgi:HEAT repeat protein
LGDKQAIAPLLAKLDDPASEVRLAVIEALGQLGDKQAIAPLLAKLNTKSAELEAAAAVALHTLSESKGTEVLTRLLTSKESETRRNTIRIYARQRGRLEQQLLSCDSDALSPWIDPQEPITEARVTVASRLFKLTPEQVRSLYEAMSVDLNLKLAWRGEAVSIH